VRVDKAGSVLLLYGLPPLRRSYCAEHAAFDAQLLGARDPAWGLRDLEAVIDLAGAAASCFGRSSRCRYHLAVVFPPPQRSGHLTQVRAFAATRATTRLRADRKRLSSADVFGVLEPITIDRRGVAVGRFVSTTVGEGVLRLAAAGSLPPVEATSDIALDRFAPRGNPSTECP